ncbi:MAG: hypothetical protein P4L50_00275 [Anaerolineaceae bacterium]|nr:hypothetical protein [Anaerolineaceae bacterium]
MILDGSLLFTGTSNGASGGITSTAYTDAPTTGTQTASNIVDLGVPSGVPSSASGGGARDIGIGQPGVLKLMAISTVAFTVGTSMQLELDGAADNGAGAPSGTWTPMWTSPVINEAQMTAGAILANVDVPRVVPGQVLPRFLRLRYITVGTHTLGQVEAGIVLDQDLHIVGTGGALSGYPAGITVSN